MEIDPNLSKKEENKRRKEEVEIQKSQEEKEIKELELQRERVATEENEEEILDQEIEQDEEIELQSKLRDHKVIEEKINQILESQEQESDLNSINSNDQVNSSPINKSKKSKRTRQVSYSTQSLHSNHNSSSTSNSPRAQNVIQNQYNQNLISSLDPTLKAIHQVQNNDLMTTDPELMNHQINRSPKRKKYSDLDSLDLIHKSITSNRPSLDTIQLAHLITSIQVQQEQGSPTHAQPGPSSHIPAYPPLPPYLTQSSVMDQDLMDKMNHLLNPLKIEISRLRSRIETLEEERLVMAREITALKGCFKNYPDLVNPQSRPLTRSHTIHQTPTSNQDESRIFPTGINFNSNHSFDIPVGPLPDLLQSNQSSSNNMNSVAHLLSAAQNSETKSNFTFRHPDSTPSTSSKPSPGIQFRRANSTRKKSEAPSSHFDTISYTPSNSNNRSKHRKPELSRTVRATVFRLMGVSSIQSPSSASENIPNDTACKFGSEKSRAYHGYTTSPCFPEYTTEELIDPITKAKLWRWDWSKTIRQSQNNTNFAKEIRNVIVKEAEDPVRPMHTDVPAIDWQYLNDAIDSAYTNMRRERDNLIDPNKMVKKEVHRARNKKRGLKEDKYKRRRKALDEYKADPSSFNRRLRDLNLAKLPEKPINVHNTSVGTSMNGEEGDQSYASRWEDALDIKYMSSEDEANLNDLENPIAVGIEQPTQPGNNHHRTENNLASSDKVFAICRPTWRSQQLQNFFSFLDAVKQPERAYRRVMGPNRVSSVPFGTPAWMVDEIVNQDNANRVEEGSSLQ